MSGCSLNEMVSFLVPQLILALCGCCATVKTLQPGDDMTNYLATFYDADDNMTALVFESNHKAGGFGVALRDDDSGSIIGASFHGFQSLNAAIAKAKELI